MPTSSRRTRRAATPASRSSSSAPGRTGATAPISRAMTARCRSRRCSARSSACSTTTSRRAESATQLKLLEGLAQALGLEAPPQRIEVYDNSHIQGSHPVGAMIVAGPDGFQKNAYRKFNIRGGDGGKRADEGELAAA